jgi:hypothetical protein
MFKNGFDTIKQNLSQIADLSLFIKDAINNPDLLFDHIDNLPIDTKSELHRRYANTNGSVLDIRKKVVESFLSGPIDRNKISAEFNTGKTTTPKLYRPYKNLYSILYPFITTGTNQLVYDTLEALATQIRDDLNLQRYADIKCVTYEGGRNTGSEHAWFAIYNNSYPSQENAKQMFFTIVDGKCRYSLFNRRTKTMKDETVVDVADLDYEELLRFYMKFHDEILADNVRSQLLIKHPIGKIISQLRAGQIRSWLVKPGQKAAMWKKALIQENIRIGWGFVIDDAVQENNYDDDFILDKLDEHYSNEGKRQTNNKVSIKSFLVEVKEHDVVFAVSGTKDIIGVGIFTSAINLDEDEEEYKAFRKVDWLIDLIKKPYTPDYSLPIKTVTALESKYAVDIICEIFNYTPPSIIEKMELPFINTLLYGPPGTGKTYELYKYQQSLFIDSGITKTQEELLKERVAGYPLWKVMGAVLATSTEALTVGQIVDHRLIKAKINPANKTKPSQLAWADLQSYANDESTQLDEKYRRSIKLFQKGKESRWSISEDKRDEISVIIDQELLELSINPVLSASASVSSNTRFNFITFHQKYGYEDFIEGIKPLIRKNDNLDEDVGQLQFEEKKGIFYNSCLAALKLAGYNSFEECFKDSKEQRKQKFVRIKHDTTKQFALFIDEINRANISAVFGELITLIEEDKRMGAINEMWVELPCSREKFSVPQNLFLMGTMNTADRSIALLDIALRRRFEFKPLYPIYVENEWWGALLESINKAIYNWKKNPDFFIGHAFFMNKTESERTNILNGKIIPLLLEYCQSNADAVRKILAESGIAIKPSSIKDNFQIVAE